MIDILWFSFQIRLESSDENCEQTSSLNFIKYNQVVLEKSSTKVMK